MFHYFPRAIHNTHIYVYFTILLEQPIPDIYICIFIYIEAKKWYSAITGLWFWWPCAGCATSAPNLLNLRYIFRHINPALTKLNPKVFAHYMRGAVKDPKIFYCCLPKDKNVLDHL